jgi:hypothetical protein
MKPLGSGRTAAFVLLLPLLGACDGGAGFAILSQSAGNVAASGVERSFSGAAIKTFTADRAAMDRATRDALARMGFDIYEIGESGPRLRIYAGSPERDVVVLIETVARNTTRLRVEVDDGYVFSADAATATEVLTQIAKARERAKDDPKAEG